IPIIGSVTALVASLYANATTEDVVDSEELDLGMNSKKVARIPIQSSGTAVSIPVNIAVVVTRSRLVEGGLVDGKFNRDKVSQTLFDLAPIPVGAGKTVPLAELLGTAADERSK